MMEKLYVYLVLKNLLVEEEIMKNIYIVLAFLFYYMSYSFLPCIINFFNHIKWSMMILTSRAKYNNYQEQNISEFSSCRLKINFHSCLLLDKMK